MSTTWTSNLDDAQRAVIETIERDETAGWMVSSIEWKLIAYRDWFSCRRAAEKKIPTAVEQV